VSATATVVAAAASTDRLDVESAVAGEEAAGGNLKMYSSSVGQRQPSSSRLLRGMTSSTPERVYRIGCVPRVLMRSRPCSGGTHARRNSKATMSAAVAYNRLQETTMCMFSSRTQRTAHLSEGRLEH
jgi:hypothetical protein